MESNLTIRQFCQQTGLSPLAALARLRYLRLKKLEQSQPLTK